MTSDHWRNPALPNVAWANRHFTQVIVLLVSLLALVPSLTTSEFSLVTLVLTGVSALWMPARIYSAFTQPHDGGSRPLVLVRHLVSILGFAILICATVRMAFKMGDSRKLLAA